MKERKIVLIGFILITFINSNSYSQRIQSPALSSGLCVKRYDIIIDGYYGYPFLMGILVKKVLVDSLSSTTITRIRNLNHIGGKFEYMVWSRIGLGIEYT